MFYRIMLCYIISCIYEYLCMSGRLTHVLSHLLLPEVAHVQPQTVPQSTYARSTQAVLHLVLDVCICKCRAWLTKHTMYACT